MPSKLKRFIGTVLLILLVTAYPFCVLPFAAAILPHANGVGQLLFYAIAGLIWVPPAGFIIKWMHGAKHTNG